MVSSPTSSGAMSEVAEVGASNFSAGDWIVIEWQQKGGKKWMDAEILEVQASFEKGYRIKINGHDIWININEYRIINPSIKNNSKSSLTRPAPKPLPVGTALFVRWPVGNPSYDNSMIAGDSESMKKYRQEKDGKNILSEKDDSSRFADDADFVWCEATIIDERPHHYNRYLLQFTPSETNIRAQKAGFADQERWTSLNKKSFVSERNFQILKAYLLKSFE